MAVTKWTNTNGGDWNTAGNWDNGVPDSTNDAVIDAASFADNGKVITISAAASCLSLDCSLADQTFSITSAVYSLSIYGHVALSDKLTWTFTSTTYVYLKAVDARNITMNGCVPAFNRLYFDGVGGSWTNQDAMSFTGSIYHTNGSWLSNNKNITTTSSYITATGTKVLTLGSSVFTVFMWSNQFPTGFTFNKDTSTVIITASTTSTFLGADTFYNLTVTAQSSIVSQVNIEGTKTITNTLTANGVNSSNYRLLIASNTIGTPRTITCGSLVASNIDFRDITLVQLNGGLDANETDNLIIDLNKSAWGGTGKVLYLKGSNAVPTIASAAAILSLQGKGVTVSTN